VEGETSMTNQSERHEVVVIGAGQSGLAAGYNLARRGLDFVILEAGDRVGDVWRKRYDSLLLYSPASGDELPGLRFPLPRRAFPTGRQMADYLEAYATHHQLPVRTGIRVQRLSAAGSGEGEAGFEVSTTSGTYVADQVIVATGAFQHPRIPDFAAQLDSTILQLHSSEYRGPHQLADGPVLVVGVGHSGADLGHEVALAGHRTILSGRVPGQLPVPIDSWRGRHLEYPVARFMFTKLFTLGTPVGRRLAAKARAGTFAPPLLRVRRQELKAAGVELREARTVGVEGGKPRLADGSVLDVRNVIWCTGFRPDFGWIDLPILTAGVWPVQRRGVIESVPGLYVLGLPFLYSFASLLVLGAPRDAAHVVDQLAARARDRTAQPATADAGTSAA
jgi:putative flavoprotein involved in K+ transport